MLTQAIAPVHCRTRWPAVNEEGEVEQRSRWLLRRRFRYVVVVAIQCLIVVGCVAVTTYAATRVQEDQVREATTERVLAVAQSLAELDQVQETIGEPTATAELQPLADLIMEASGVDYVVISDAAGIRVTHPNPAERGRPLSTDPTAVLGGQTFIGTETGTLGPTLRAKVPVYRDGVIVGGASVGILESEIAADLRSSLVAMTPWVLVAVLVGVIGAAAVARMVGNRVRRLEAENAELGEQRRLSQALREQTHEFRTQVHAVYGLVENGDVDAALDYLGQLAPVIGTDAATRAVADPRLRAVLGAIAAEFETQHGSVDIDPLTAVGDGVLGDEDIVLIANLVRNAAEAAGRGGNVHVLIHADVIGTEVVVEDDGPGIDAAALPTLVEHGYSTKMPDGDHAPRGVGLALVWRIVHERGGDIEVGRSPNGGARLTVRLPALAGVESRSGEPKPRPTSDAGAAR